MAYQECSHCQPPNSWACVCGQQTYHAVILLVREQHGLFTQDSVAPCVSPEHEYGDQQEPER